MSIRYSLFIAILVLVICVLQYDFWWSKSGYFSTKNLRQSVALESSQNQKLKLRNDKLYSEILSLRHSNEVLEGMARENLGLIKAGEVFYQFIPKNQIATVSLKET